MKLLMAIAVDYEKRNLYFDLFTTLKQAQGFAAFNEKLGHHVSVVAWDVTVPAVATAGLIHDSSSLPGESEEPKHSESNGRAQA